MKGAARSGGRWWGVDARLGGRANMWIMRVVDICIYYCLNLNIIVILLQYDYIFVIFLMKTLVLDVNIHRSVYL